MRVWGGGGGGVGGLGRVCLWPEVGFGGWAGERPPAALERRTELERGLGAASVMAKLFYSVAEAAEKLGKSEDEIRQMASSGQLEEFREGNDLVFKAEQVNLLAGDEDDDDISLDLGDGLDLADSGLGASSMIGLADSEIDLGESSLDLTDSGAASQAPIALDDDTGAAAENDSDEIALDGSSLASVDAGGGLSGGNADDDGGDLGGAFGDGSDAADQTGISIFADEDATADASADTFVGDGGGLAGIDLSTEQLDSVGSGSGLMDLTREGDDTSLGVDLLDDAYAGGDASGMEMTAATGDTLFESTDAIGGDMEAAAAAMVAAPAAAYDGTGSGLVLGLSIGAALAMLFVGAVFILEAVGVGAGLILDPLKDLPVSQWIPAIALFVITAVGAGLGAVLMKSKG